MSKPFLSRRPYVIPVYWHWLVDSGYRPHLVVKVDYPGVSVPKGYDEGGRIVLDVHPEAVDGLEIDQSWIVFQAVFGEQIEHVRLPIGSIILMFAPESNWFEDFSDDPEPMSPVTPKGKGPSRFTVLPKSG